MKAITITALLCFVAYSTKSFKSHGNYTYEDYQNRQQPKNKVKQAYNAFHEAMNMSKVNERIYRQQNRATH